MAPRTPYAQAAAVSLIIGAVLASMAAFGELASSPGSPSNQTDDLAGKLNDLPGSDDPLPLNVAAAPPAVVAAPTAHLPATSVGTEYIEVQSGRCGDWLGCTAASSSEECSLWAASLFKAAENRSVVDVPVASGGGEGPAGCRRDSRLGVSFSANGEGKVQCDRALRCICECTNAIDVAFYAYKGASPRGKRNIPLVLRQPEVIDGVPLKPIRVHELGQRSDWEVQLNRGAYDVVLVPGGSGSTIARGLGSEGKRAVTRFLRRGGGYVGVCAGYYLASSSLRIAPKFKRAYPHGLRGDGNATVALTPFGARVLRRFGLNETFLSKGNKELVFYANGPTYTFSGEEAASPRNEVLLTFDSQVPMKPNKQVAAKIRRGDTGKGFAAVVASAYGAGTVVLSSHHPESSPLYWRKLHGPPSAPGSVLAAMLQSYVRFAEPGVAVELHAEEGRRR